MWVGGVGKVRRWCVDVLRSLEELGDMPSSVSTQHKYFKALYTNSLRPHILGA